MRLNMNIEFYKDRLKSLLVKNYELLKESGQKVRRDLRIEGFMEAGLCLGLLFKDDLKQVIYEAHIEVFGVPFAEKIRAKSLDDELLDIPTWIRDKLDIDKI